jgi:urea carboxylase
MLKKILIANRGEIACRIVKTCKKLNIKTVAIHSKVDEVSLHALQADEAVLIESNSPLASYLDQEKIIEAAINTNCDAIIPGYGFLSENPDFVRACKKANIAFIGPDTEAMEAFSLKHTAREIARKNNVPIISGSDILKDVNEAIKEAQKIGFPVLLKCSGGGGGIGMQICRNITDVEKNFSTAQKTGKACFNNDAVYLEKYVSEPRHIEVQIFGDGEGNVIALGERECSIQRRFQKILEETPSPFVSETLRQNLFASAKKLGETVKYRSAGTVEFIVDGTNGDFFFLEVNTRLQVEHPVTEETTGIDIVEWMIRMAGEKKFSIKNYHHIAQGHSIEVRLCAEDPSRNFTPSTGTLTEVFFPQYSWSRFDFGVKTGSVVSSHYDPMLGKIIVYGKTRTQAIERMKQCLSEFRISGITTNLSYLKQIVNSSDFNENKISTEFLNNFSYTSSNIEVVAPGFYTTIQDCPGRTHYWRIGVPPSGPVDALAFQIANALVGNDYGTAGLEMTLNGPTLRFHCDAVIAITGAHMKADIDGKPVEYYNKIQVNAGSVLSVKNIDESGGFRTYMAVLGGFDIPDYLGSKSTFCFGNFGGLTGNTLKAGDNLPFYANRLKQKNSLPKKYRPQYNSKVWEIGVTYGPHGAPDFFTDDDIKMFFNSEWRVHHNSNRLGIRLIGPKPKWTRKDGGEAGLHPSNIHDCEYAIGAINFTGDMPIILNCDGPSLGGFVCPATIVQAEIWKLGQISANDIIKFRRISYEQALEAKSNQFKFLEKIRYGKTNELNSDFSLNYKVGKNLLYKNQKNPRYNDAIVHEIAKDSLADSLNPRVLYRAAGDNYLLIEYGDLVLDLNLRFRVHLLMEWFEKNPVSGVIELSPGVRSVQVHYDSSKLHLSRLLEILSFAETQLPDINDAVIPSRILKLPLAFDDKWNKEAIEKYSRSIKSSAPYLPSNIDFIARINGLENNEKVKEIILDASYLVLGLGDVYLGAPCAVPIDPRHRLVTSKYNPARTFTPEGSVGIGGVYMCIYGMDSPGGYQLVGRTLPIWNKYTNNSCFKSGEPWLLKFFDQVQYYQVSDDELEEMRQKFANGILPIEIEETEIRPKEINKFLKSIEKEVVEFKAKQNVAFEKELKHWQDSGMIGGEESNDNHNESPVDETIIPEDCFAVHAHAGGSVWDILVAEKDEVEQGKPIVILEAMKTEIKVDINLPGIIQEIKVKKGQLVNQGDILFIVKHG